MIFKVLSLIAGAALLVGAVVWYTPASEELSLEGETGIEMLQQVREATKDLRSRDRLVVTITSPGGPVITSLEIARLLRAASDRGAIVEVHARALCASGCTFVLAAGTPGQRFIGKETFFLVHPPQQGGGFSAPTCLSFRAVQGVEDKVVNEILREMLTAYMVYTGRSERTVLDWIACGNERVGNGRLALEMGIADQVD